MCVTLYVNRVVCSTATMVDSDNVLYFEGLSPLNKNTKIFDYIRKARNPTAFHVESIIMTVKYLHLSWALFFNLGAPINRSLLSCYSLTAI